jgi:predicted transcriptional regulator YheO
VSEASARAFAEALARTLGPLYRVVLLDERGETIASHGRFRDGRVVGEPIPLPGGRGSVRIEVDHRTIETADRVLHDLAVSRDRSEAPLGAFSHLEDALEHLIAQGEAHLGRPLAQMSRGDKQQLVRYLDERGAFALRKAVERVAATLGVSRFTVYNYLDAARTD